jgi:hypothetical protein
MYCIFLMCKVGLRKISLCETWTSETLVSSYHITTWRHIQEDHDFSVINSYHKYIKTEENFVKEELMLVQRWKWWVELEGKYVWK